MTLSLVRFSLSSGNTDAYHMPADGLNLHCIFYLFFLLACCSYLAQLCAKSLLPGLCHSIAGGKPLHTVTSFDSLTTGLRAVREPQIQCRRVHAVGM